jgi:hypothetical protein
MSIPRPLVECIYANIALLDYSSDDEIDPDTAVKGLETIAFYIGQLGSDDQREFLSICQKISYDYERDMHSDIPALIADSLGVDLPLQ